VLKDAGPRWVFADYDNPPWVDAVRARIPADVRFFNLQPGQGPLQELAPGAGGRPAFEPAATDSDDGLVIIHTAAVAGQPRGALLSHRNLICANAHLMHGFGLTTRDVHLSVLPLFHVAGLCMTLCAFHAGCLNISQPKFDADLAVRLIARRRVSFMFTFAPILKSILDARDQTQADIRSLRAVMGLDTAEVIERFQKAAGGTFHTMYGQTETSMLASMGPYNDCPGAAGRPVAISAVQLMDDDDRPVPTGQVGEIAMRGPMVFKGYWGLEKDNARTFRNDWHHTGDLGRLDSSGFLWYAGRKADKELIKPGGENVYPAEVEKAILDHPAVEAAVVLGVADPKWKEAIKAVCVLAKGRSLSARELIDFVGGRIARYKKPKYVEFVETLPRKADGTIDRQKVKQMFGE
jgi:acyl-CoA synthetase (AMP-forming)/AMP-acid ligase II